MTLEEYTNLPWGTVVVVEKGPHANTICYYDDDDDAEQLLLYPEKEEVFIGSYILIPYDNVRRATNIERQAHINSRG